MAKALKIPTIFSAVDKFTPTVEKMGRATTKFTKKASVQFAKVDRSVRKLKNSMSDVAGKFGKVTALVGGLALGAGLAQGAEAVISFDKSLTAASAKFGIFDKQSQGFLNLADVAKDIGASTQFSAGQAGEGLNFLAMAGFSAQEAIQALPGVVNLAIAAETDLATATDIASDAIGAFGLQNKDLTRITDVMAKTTTTANTTMVDMFEAIKDGAPIATAAGASMETISAMIGKMANAGIKGSKAGTTLKNMFLNLAAPTAKAQKVLDSFGVKTVDKATGNLRDVNAILGDLNKSMAGLGTAEKATALSSIFGKIGVAGATILVNEGAESLNNYRASLEGADGSAAKMAEFMGQGLFGVVASMNSAFESIAITIGETFAGEIDHTIKRITTFARNTQKWITENKELVKTIVNIALWVAKFAIAIKLISVAIAIYKAVIAAAAVVQSIFAAAVSATLWPILAIIAAIAAIILIIQNWDKITSHFSKSWGRNMSHMSQKWDEMVVAFKSGDIGGAFKSIGQAILNFLLIPMRSVFELWAKMPGSVGNFASSTLASIDKLTGMDSINVAAQNDMAGAGVLINPEASKQKALTERKETTTTNNSTLEIKDYTGMASLFGDNDNIQLTPTLGF